VRLAGTSLLGVGQAPSVQFCTADVLRSLIVNGGVCAATVVALAGRAAAAEAENLHQRMVLLTGYSGPSTRVISARIRVKRASVASADSCCPSERAATGAWRLLKIDRISSALCARTPLVKSPGPIPAAKAISRQRQMSAISVSLDRTLVTSP
jgi:hypothetical protein